MTIWYLARATGFVALIAFTLSTALGALSASPKATASPDHLDGRFLRQMAHRSAAIIGLAFLLAHATLIIIDSFVNVSLSGALIPFTAGFRPIALAAGTLSIYAIAAVAISGALRGRLATSVASARRWRYFHLSAYAGWALAMAHGVFSGTDTGSWWAISTYAVCANAVSVAISIRLVAEMKHRARPLSAARNLSSRSLV